MANEKNPFLISYVVSSSTISPATIQRIGMSNNHNVTELEFSVDNKLRDAVQNYVENGQVFYRFDVYNSAGEVARTVPRNVAESEYSDYVFYYELQERDTRYGGAVRVVLVLSVLVNSEVVKEVFCPPAVLQIVGLPYGRSRYSYTELTEAVMAIKQAYDNGELKGDKGDKGDKGEKGDNGGQKGDKGDSGVYVGSGEMPANCNVQIDPDGNTFDIDDIINIKTDERYFDIDYDGIVSLKPEYQNGGSKNAELPAKIVIPDVVNKTAVSGLQAGMFEGNIVVEEITIPSSVTEIPNRFCAQARNLKAIHNTEQITKVGDRVILKTQVKKAIFPSLKEVGSGAFAEGNFLYIADIGDNITDIPEGMFRNCPLLSLVKGGASVKKIGAQAFYETRNLKNLPLLVSVTSIGDLAFYKSRIQFDWDSLENCTFGARATPVIDNTVKYWEGFQPEACENRIVTQMSQTNAEWRNKPFGNSGKLYEVGCAVFAVLHIHSALSGKLYNHPDEFAAELEAINEDLVTIGSHPTHFSNVAPMFKALGYEDEKVEVHTEAINSTLYQKVCNALKNGGYIYTQVSTPVIDDATSIDDGHVVVIYGINSNGEVLVLDSATANWGFEEFGGETAYTYRMPFQNLTGPSSNFVIVNK